MTAAQPNLLELAKQGDARAIATMLNTALQPEGITIRAGYASDCLMVTAESPNPPNQADIVGFMRELLTDLRPARTKRVVVQGRVTGQPAPVWHEAFDLVPAVEAEPEAASAEPEAVAPEPAIATSAPISQTPTPLPEKPAAKNSQKSLLFAGASVAAFVLCLLIGRQAFEQTTSANNALLVPRQKASSPAATTATSPQPDSRATNQPKTELETAPSPPSQSTIEMPATSKTTIVASLKPGSITKNEVKSSSSKPNSVSAQGNLEASLQTANKSLTPIQLKSTTTTQQPSSKNSSCKSINDGLNQQIYQQCLAHGMTRNQMVQVMGSTGDEMSRVGSVVTYKWMNQKNKVIATFHHDRLISKSLVPGIRSQE